MIRICFPLVRYTLKMPVPPADIPRLKNLACTVNRGESGSTRTANGSSKDSSISCSVKELSRLKGGLFQSNSMLLAGMSIQRPCNVFTLYLHLGISGCQQEFLVFLGSLPQRDHSCKKLQDPSTNLQGSSNLQIP